MKTKTVHISSQADSWRFFEWPASLKDLAQRRTQQLLFPRFVTRVPISTLVQSAYLQGLADGVNSVVNATAGEAETK